MIIFILNKLKFLKLGINLKNLFISFPEREILYWKSNSWVFPSVRKMSWTVLHVDFGKDHLWELSTSKKPFTNTSGVSSHVPQKVRPLSVTQIQSRRSGSNNTSPELWRVNNTRPPRMGCEKALLSAFHYTHTHTPYVGFKLDLGLN
jgi:hypothetical protein